MEIKKIGFDPGFGDLKLAMIAGGEISAIKLPAEVGLPTSINEIRIGSIIKSGKTEKPYLIRFNGGSEYLVGPNVGAFNRPITRMDFERFTDSEELRASWYVGMYKLLGPGNHAARMIVSLPVAVLSEESQANEVKRNVARWMVGEHVFEVDGKPVTVTVDKIRDAPQPVAAWLYWGLDCNGVWDKGDDALKAPTAVIDQGYNTLDVITVANGKIIARRTGGANLGMSQAARRLCSALARSYGLKIDLRDADNLIVEWVSTGKSSVYVKGDLVDISPVAKQVLSSLASDVVDFCQEHIENQEGYRILLTGGGALALFDRLIKTFPSAELLSPPDMAGAIGLAKLAQRPNYL